MTAYTKAYSQLNAAQKRAVDTIEGPVLVIAGPGTGKTQLLSARVANILVKTDTPPQNVLCLTFTESGATNMRQRLTRFIGQAAYHITISTYHAFGSDLIGRYPEYFLGTRMQNAVDDLGRRQIVLEIVEAMSYQNPLKQTRYHLGDLLSTISELKRSLLTSTKLRALAAENGEFISTGSRRLQPILSDFSRMPSSYAKALPYFQRVLVALGEIVPAEPISQHFNPLGSVCVSHLQAALDEAAQTTKTTELTVWKNTWLAKGPANHFIIAGELENRRIHALADVLDSYQTSLESQGLYDFDDMILRTIEALETNSDFRYTIQERYLYILLDEFQDTNAAQLRLVQLLTDNPVNEGRPNILAVGDDDQAIYAFQGAQYFNMLEYYQMYRGTVVINLVDNYRSHADILSTASAVTAQIAGRLQESFPGITKNLRVANSKILGATIERREFQSDIAERAWIAQRVKALIDAGSRASDIAILAPKHKQLEPLVPYLNAAGVPVRYEKRENILEAPVVRQLLTMGRLIAALAAGNQVLADSLWPQILSYDFWQIPIAVIWEISWKVSDSHLTHDETALKCNWAQAILHSDDPTARRAAHVLLTIAGRIATDTSETILDFLIGSEGLETHDLLGTTNTIFSPLRNYYTSPEIQAKNPELFYETLSHLTVLRARLREFQDQSDAALMLTDFLRFIDRYTVAEQPMINTSPYSQQADAVQLLTVFKAKGLEFQHVFLPSCQDDVWGASARGNSNKLTLPANLQLIRHAGATDDERLRILFVALTRARSGLYLTSAARSFSGRSTRRLQYFNEQEQPDGNFVSKILPASSGQVHSDDSEAPDLKLLTLDWQTRHLESPVDINLVSLLSDRIANYRMSPTHLTSFIDLQYGGPQRFFFDTILRFPGVSTPDSQFGTAIHETLEWYQHQVSEYDFAPALKKTLEYYGLRIRAKKLTTAQYMLQLERGKVALTNWLAERSSIFKAGDVSEKNFHSEGVLYNNVHMAGRIDRMELDSAHKTLTVIDYKTGKSYSRWKPEIRLHKYQLQLYAYKLLIEGSHTYNSWAVPSGRLEFIESNSDGQIKSLDITFTNEETIRVKKLLAVVWQHVQSMSFPSTSAYPVTLAGVRQFEADLIDGKI